MSDFILPYGAKLKVQKGFSKPSRTKQAFKEECDINRILAKYKRNMGKEYLSVFRGYMSGSFRDVSEVTDLIDAKQKVDEALQAFNALPSDVRRRFANDPMELLEFVADDRNRDEAVKLGLIEEPVKAPEESAHEPS